MLYNFGSQKSFNLQKFTAETPLTPFAGLFGLLTVESLKRRTQTITTLTQNLPALTLTRNITPMTIGFFGWTSSTVEILKQLTQLI